VRDVQGSATEFGLRLHADVLYTRHGDRLGAAALVTGVLGYLIKVLAGWPVLVDTLEDSGLKIQYSVKNEVRHDSGGSWTRLVETSKLECRH